MQTEFMKVTGMTCGGCIGNVTSALKAIAGVDDVNASLSAGEVTVTYDESLTSPEPLRAAVKKAGYGVGSIGDAQAQPTKTSCCS